MTEELNRKADEYLKAQCLKRKDCLVLEMPDHYITDVKQAYIDGATENGIQWHDLRKYPNDLPKKEDDYFLCLYDKETKSIFYEVFGLAKRYSDREEWYVESMLWNIEDVIAWCEIPQFNVI